MIIDTHSHLQFAAYTQDMDEVIKRTLAADMLIVNVGTSYQTSKGAVELAKKYDRGFYAAIGLHPMYAGAEFIKIKHDPNEEEFLVKEDNFDKEKYKKLALSGSRRVVAIGEIGLDYYYKPKTVAKLAEFKEKQKQVFLQQLDLAKELGLPVILHCRMAHQNLIEILKSKIKNQNAKLSVVVHCFTGNLEEAKQYVDLGLHLGFNGIIFKLSLDEVIKNTPLDKMVVETDCPYLTPPMAPNKRNEPVFIKHTIQKIADIKGVSFQEVCDATTQNARKLFKI